MLYRAARVGVGCLVMVSGASGETFDFMIDSTTSGIAGAVNVGIETTGTLVGDYDETTNPTGTRTKPGVDPFGAFGPTENVPVPLSLGSDLGGPVDTSTSGRFTLIVDTVANTVVMSGFQSSGDSDTTIPLSASLLFDGFRTRTPDSTFPGGVPVDIPLGDSTISNLMFTQTVDVPGVLVPVDSEPNAWDVLVTPIVNINATVSVFDNPVPLEDFPFALVISGRLTIDGDTATFAGAFPVAVDESGTPGTPLPQVPFPIPTILPPGGTANVLLDLILAGSSVGLNGTLTLNATAEPSCLCELDGNTAAVNTSDLLTYLGFWFADDLEADLNGSGSVDTADLLLFLGCWFTASSSGVCE